VIALLGAAFARLSRSQASFEDRQGHQRGEVEKAFGAIRRGPRGCPMRKDEVDQTKTEI